MSSYAIDYNWVLDTVLYKTITYGRDSKNRDWYVLIVTSKKRRWYKVTDKEANVLEKTFYGSR